MTNGVPSRHPMPNRVPNGHPMPNGAPRYDLAENTSPAPAGGATQHGEPLLPILEEEAEGDSDRETVHYEDAQEGAHELDEDLYVDELFWEHLTAAEKLSSNSQSFSHISWEESLHDSTLTSMAYAASAASTRKKNRARAEASVTTSKSRRDQELDRQRGFRTRGHAKIHPKELRHKEMGTHREKGCPRQFREMQGTMGAAGFPRP